MLQQVIKESVLILEKRKNDRVRHVPAMLDRISALLLEGYIFSDALLMLLPYHVKDIEIWTSRIQQQFSKGASVVDILQPFLIPKHLLIMIQIAEEKGDLPETLKHVANQMKFIEQMRKKITKLLMYPTFLIVILTTIFVLFRTYFLPNLQQIASSSHNLVTSLTLTSTLLHLPDIFLLFLFTLVCLSILSIYLVRRQKVENQIMILLRVPIVNYFYKLNITRHFSRLLGSLLVAGFSLQQALSILEEQDLSRHLSHITTLVKKRVIFGDSLSNAINILQLFAPNFEVFIKHGEKTGYLGREMLIYTELLDERMKGAMKIFISSIQPTFFIIIALCIVAVYLSMLLPMYDLIDLM